MQEYYKIESEQRPIVRNMSASGLTPEAQLQYILQWFQEFSELQREDFLPVLAAAHGDRPDQLAATLSSLSCQDKPVSLFQCRIKLFNEWYPTWAEEGKERLVKKISDLDPDFSSKLQEALVKGTPMNGDGDGLDAYATKDPIERQDTQSNTDQETVEQSDDNLELPPTHQDNISVEITAAS
ncbi:unnamed protein product [Parnassius apollo]|uniref:(apollo) hypothetical protein n=1 Tax=Parnassius apollo TaxID=110799 RepID=A0A8S3WDN9_PARAO|nr:unnamed protein product [Parnassius apollo]